ncbi:uncharacterized protein LOC122505925 [Leptopilina heterotoma]|uniref:uncharacterized protein LOC122505925 n=1 Tax=Leptopilina heterotoma TaxID=63436 RepID=UPI001CA9B67E|nr:uncharacterized protein LOC122505925 [Leptopilina heterotoma]
MHFSLLLVFLLLLPVHDVLGFANYYGTRNAARDHKCYTCINGTHFKFGECKKKTDDCNYDIPNERSTTHDHCVKQGPFYCCYYFITKPHEIPKTRDFSNPKKRYPADVCAGKS